MCIEALTKKQFSEKSDVWSFGITSIEILTRNIPCKKKYFKIFSIILFFFLDPGLNAIEATQVTSNGLRPQFPQETRLKLQEIIANCWKDDPNERPSFKQLLLQLQQLN